MNIFKISLTASLLFFKVFSFAQEDSIKMFPVVEVTANRFSTFSSGTKKDILDSSILSRYTTNNLADVLNNETPIFIKSYGLGNLATASFRGGNANHTAILWNGFNINSAMNGGVDLSLLPNQFVDEIIVQYGGASALWGSGAVSGSIHLNSNPLFNKSLSVGLGGSIGSFSTYKQTVFAQYSGEKFITTLKFFNQTAKNNFPFINEYLEKSPLQIQLNSELKQYGVLSENYFKISNYQKVNLRFWYQLSDKNIAPIMLQSYSDAKQTDESYRITSEWQCVTTKATLFARAAYFIENLFYTNSIGNVNSLNNANTFITEIESRIPTFKNQLLNIGVNNTYVQAKSGGYKNSPSQNRIALFTAYNYESESNIISTSVSARQELMDNRLVPFTYSLNINYNATKCLGIYANGAKVYRIPTFNDLYWEPGGNPNLLSEEGFTEEVGLRLNVNLTRINSNLMFEPTVFNKQLDNWIIWLPNGINWTPQNILQVWSRGVETRTSIKTKIKNLNIKIGATTNYVLSTNQKSTTPNDASVGKQLMYVPIYKIGGNFSIEYHNFSITYNHTYVGYRYTATDNSQYLKPFQLANLNFSKSLVVKKYKLNFFIQINNLYKESYQVTQNYAMPMQNFEAGFSIKYN
ncbi:MAG: TonB-dependent receptor [Bacteroidia bacterium]